MTAREWKSPLEIVGAGTKQSFGRAVVTMGSVLDVSGLRGILSYEPNELILTAAPGTPVAEIETALAQKGQRLGFDPPDWGPLLGAAPGQGTIGGAIACDANGPARVRLGAVRDQLLGFRGVNGFGEAFKAGGKVVKNVTGFDAPKLMCGAMGTLCVLTEVTLRVFPKPPLSTVLALRDLSPEEGFALLRKVWSSPLDATGLAFSHDRILIRLEGEKAPLAEKCAMLQALLDGREAQEVPEGEIAFRAIGGGRGLRRYALRCLACLRAAGERGGRRRRDRRAAVARRLGRRLAVARHPSRQRHGARGGQPRRRTCRIAARQRGDARAARRIRTAKRGSNGDHKERQGGVRSARPVQSRPGCGTGSRCAPSSRPRS